MKIAMRLLGTFTPVFLTFGPVFMVISGHPDTPMAAIIGFGGAVGLGFGLVYLFWMVLSLKNELDELNHHDKLTE